MIAYSIQGASARTEPQAHASTTKRQVSGKEFSFKLSSKSIAKPGRVAFNFRNVGHLAHNFKVNGKHTPDVQPGKTAKPSSTSRRSVSTATSAPSPDMPPRG